MFDEVRDTAYSVWPKYIEQMVEKVGEVVELKVSSDGDSTWEFQVRTFDVRRLLIAEFKLSKMLGTLWLYSNGAYVCADYRGKGIGTVLNKFRIALAERAGAWGLLSFVRGDNLTQRRILRQNGWALLNGFASDGYVQEVWAYCTDNFGRKGL